MRTQHPLPAAPALEILKQRRLCDSEKAELDSFPGVCLRSSTWEPRPQKAPPTAVISLRGGAGRELPGGVVRTLNEEVGGVMQALTNEREEP